MLVISVFVILVMGFLGLAMTQLLSSATNSIAFEVMGQRALNAARAGLERNVARVFAFDYSETDGVTGDGIQPSQCQANQPPVSLNGVVGFANCQYSLNCQRLTGVTGSGSGDYFRFESTGLCQVSDVVVSRTVAIDARL